MAGASVVRQLDDEFGRSALQQEESAQQAKAFSGSASAFRAFVAALFDHSRHGRSQNLSKYKCGNHLRAFLRRQLRYLRPPKKQARQGKLSFGAVFKFQQAI